MEDFGKCRRVWEGNIKMNLKEKQMRMEHDLAGGMLRNG
jgi:hypothetical protein